MPTPSLPDENVTPRWIHFAVQTGAVVASHSLTWAGHLAFGAVPTTWLANSVLAGAIALALSVALRLPWWWRVIHTLFLPASLLALSADIPSQWYLWSFIFLLLVFRSAAIGKVPLYFSGRRTTRALSALLRNRRDIKFIDLGAGIGSVTHYLARTLPDSEITGVENSLIPWLIGRLRDLGAANHHWTFGNFWQIPLGSYNVVYAFLSPAPMARLWEKARKEMHPGSLFVSNSFRCPGTEPTFVIEIGGWRKTELYCYTIPAASPQANTPARNHHHRLGPT
jgi:hypothetical protein